MDVRVWRLVLARPIFDVSISKLLVSLTSLGLKKNNNQIG